MVVHSVSVSFILHICHIARVMFGLGIWGLGNMLGGGNLGDGING